MHTLPARLGALFDSTHTSQGPLQSCHVPAPPRRLPAQTSLHAALPRIGIIAAPDESLATSAARLSQQQQQQQSQPQQPAAYAPPRRVQVRRSRVGQWSQQQQQDAFTQQPTQLLQKQLNDVQLATQAQQQQLWQAQQGPAQQYQGRQQAWPGQSQQAGNSNHQTSSNRHHTSAADLQQPQQQWQGARAYRPDQQGPSDAPHAPQWQQQPAQHQQHQYQQQRQGQGQGYQPRPQQQHQQQPGSRWGPQGGSGWQSDWNQQQQQPAGRQQQQQQRHHHQQQQQQQQQHSKRPDQQRLTHPGLSDGAAASAAASDSSSSSGQQLRFSYGLKQDWSLPTGMAVTYLGSSSGAPTKDRNVSCTMLRLPESLYLVDCGEGSSRQAKLTGLPLEQVEALFITHLHGDHCFGIGTMLVAMCKARRAAAAAADITSTSSSSSSSSSNDGGQLPGPDSPGALRVVGPPRLGEVVSAMLYIAGVGRQLDQPVYITEFVEGARQAHDWQPLPVPAAAASAVSSSTSSSGGRPHCQAFIRRMAPTQELPEHEWPAGLARRLDRTGLRWQDNNTRRSTFRATPGLLWQVPCSQVTVTAAQLQHRVPCWGYVFEEKLPAAAAAAAASSSSSSGGGSGVRGRRVVLLGDTVDSRPIAPVALGADLVSHEATFAAGMEGKAAVAQHSTAWMAGQFAWAIQAKSLVLTHFSARYEGSRERSKWLPVGAEGSRRGGGGGYDAAAADAMEEERTIKALQREADDQYGLGPVGLAIDLLTAHVPKQQQQQQQQEEEGGADV